MKSINESSLWISDLEEVLAEIPDLEELSNKSVMITGCTGLICSAVVDLIARWNYTHIGKITILAAGRSEQRVKERFADFFCEDWFVFVPYDAVAADNALPLLCDYIIHGASNAFPSVIVQEPVETMISNFLGMKNLLDYARRNHSKRVLYVSSSEVYGKKDDNKPFKANEYGYIDILKPRSSYSEGKRAAETLCSSYLDEYGVDTVIVRPGHIYGPTAKRSDNRVSSSWAYDVAMGNDITMKSNGAQIRSYCYCLDCASAILVTLLRGKKGEAYNISNPDSVLSIKDLAVILAKSAGVAVRFEIPSETDRAGFNPMSNSSLDSTELQLLNWKYLFNAERGLSHTVEIIKEMRTV